VPFPHARILKIFYKHSSVRLSHLCPRIVQFPYRLESEDWNAHIFISPNVREVYVVCASSMCPKHLFVLSVIQCSKYLFFYVSD
jgi:hypothetical protein